MVLIANRHKGNQQERGKEMEITYYVQNNYGNEHWYPVSKDARFIARMCETKTLLPDAVRLAEEFYPDTTTNEVLKPRS